MKERQTLIAANWKMYKTPAESVEFCEAFLPKIAGKHDCEIALCPPFTSLAAVAPYCARAGLALGAQNVATEEEGACTGEVAARMLKAIGVTFVICGHSERRTVYGESNAVVRAKMLRVLANGMVPLLCIGEKLEEREGNGTFRVLETQLAECLKEIAWTPATLVVAYEPVWAIGTGKTASPEQAEEVHAFVREWLAREESPAQANGLRILYGGSVKPENTAELMARPDIDGALVGGASLKADSFAGIATYNT